MATTGSNFVYQGGSAAVLQGSTVTTAPFLEALDSIGAQNAINIPSGGAISLDRIIFDSSLLSSTVPIGTTFQSPGTYVGGFAKNGALVFTLTGTTAVTVDFTNLAAAVGVAAYAKGDATVTTLNELIIRNISDSASTITVAPGGSNPLDFPLTLAGTTPSIALLKDGILCEYAATGRTVDATHKNVLFTPTAGGRIAIIIGGA